MGDEWEDPTEPTVDQPSTQPAPAPAEAAPSREEAIEPPSYELPEVLQHQDPLQVLLRLQDDDPLELAARCVRIARELAVFLPPERLIAGTMARIAIAARGYRGDRPLDEWLDLAIEVSVTDLLEEQRDEERRGLPVGDSPDAAFYAELAELVDVPVADARMVCATLNGMSDDHREAFHAVIVHGLTPEAWAEENGSRPKTVYDLLREVGMEVNAKLVKRRKARRRRRL